MKLTVKAIGLLNKNAKCQADLAVQLDVTLFTIQRHIRENAEDGDLTKISCLGIISEHLGLKQDEILESVTA